MTFSVDVIIRFILVKIFVWPCKIWGCLWLIVSRKTLTSGELKFGTKWSSEPIKYFNTLEYIFSARNRQIARDCWFSASEETISWTSQASVYCLLLSKWLWVITGRHADLKKTNNLSVLEDCIKNQGLKLHCSCCRSVIIQPVFWSYKIVLFYYWVKTDYALDHRNNVKRIYIAVWTTDTD